MIRSIALVGVVLTFLAFGLGWWLKPPPPTLTTVVAPTRTAAPLVVAPGGQMRASADYFAKLYPPPPPPPVPKPPPPPPPPDVSLTFRAAIQAVIDTPQGLRLLVANRDSGARKTSLLNTGDVFRDGWQVVTFDRRHAELRKGQETRTVPFYGVLPPPPPPPAAPPPKPGRASPPTAGRPTPSPTTLQPIRPQALGQAVARPRPQPQTQSQPLPPPLQPRPAPVSTLQHATDR